jgi:CPA2 family monovalent cation:H+ antiporter-2
VAIVVSAITTLTTPWLIRASGPTASWVDRKLPRPLQTFTVLYGSWVEGLRNAPRAASTTAYIRSLLRRLLLDAALFTGIIVGITSSRGKLIAFARDNTGIQESLAFPLLIGIAVLLAAPFFLGVIRVGRKLGLTLAEVVLPAGGENRVDFAAAPRRLFTVTLELVIVIMVGAPLLALTRPFLPGAQGGALILLFIAVLGVAFWRSATNLQGHVRAGAEVIVDVLARQSQGRGSEAREDNLKQVEQLLPGLGALTAVRLETSSPAVGRTLAELNLRALTGASVLAITREAGNVVAPAAGETLRAGDVLALTGTQEAIEAARTLLGPE